MASPMEKSTQDWTHTKETHTPPLIRHDGFASKVLPDLLQSSARHTVDSSIRNSQQSSEPSNVIEVDGCRKRTAQMLSCQATQRLQSAHAPAQRNRHFFGASGDYRRVVRVRGTVRVPSSVGLSHGYNIQRHYHPYAAATSRRITGIGHGRIVPTLSSTNVRPRGTALLMRRHAVPVKRAKFMEPPTVEEPTINQIVGQLSGVSLQENLAHCTTSFLAAIQEMTIEEDSTSVESGSDEPLE